MNEREKSDPAVVAVKSANETGQPVEEQMEPMAGAEGNASRQSTLRALDRAGVSRALGRIRKAARESKKARRRSSRRCSTMWMFACSGNRI